MLELTQDEVRILAYAAPPLLKILRSREQNLLDKIYAEFRSGRNDFLPLVAEYAVLRDEIRQITKTLTENQ